MACVTPAIPHTRSTRSRAARAVHRGVAAILITFAVLPFTAPFSTCGLAALLQAPMALDGRQHAAATTMSAADPGQAVSSSNETFKDQVLLPSIAHASTVRIVAGPALIQVSRTTVVTPAPLVLRL